MDELEKKKHLDKFAEDVKWLRNHVPADDIYDFAEQALMAADFFIHKLSQVIDLKEAAEKDKMMVKWLNNVVGLRILRDKDYPGIINTELDVNK